MYGLYAKKRGRCRELAVRVGSAVLKITGTHSHRRLSKVIRNGFSSVYLSWSLFVTSAIRSYYFS